jgi:hypothetical protein
LESVYLATTGRETMLAAPSVSGGGERRTHLIPCARINWLSVCAAYARGFAGAALLFGTILTFASIVTSLCGRQMDETQRTIWQYGLAALAFGALFGGATYAFTFAVPSRGRRIRMACGRALKAAVDPAKVRRDVAESILTTVQAALAARDVPDFETAMRRPAACDPETLDLLLALTRAQIQTEGPSPAKERDTDRLLELMVPLR